MPAPRKNSDAFVAFLDTLVQQIDDHRPILLVLDNASYHHSAVAQAGFAAFEQRLMPLSCRLRVCQESSLLAKSVGV